MDQHSAAAMSWKQSMLREVGRLICGVKGHTRLVHFERDRMYLECTSCGQQSKGWDVRPHGLTVVEMTPREALASHASTIHTFDTQAA